MPIDIIHWSCKNNIDEDYDDNNNYYYYCLLIDFKLVIIITIIVICYYDIIGVIISKLSIVILNAVTILFS